MGDVMRKYVLLTCLLLASCSKVNNSSQESLDNVSDVFSNNGTTSIETPSIEDSSVVEEISSEDEVFESKAKNITNYLGSDNDIYRINIETENNVFPTNKENYVKGNLNITEQNANKVVFEGASMGIRLRGNSTLEAKKKAFRVKFDKKQSLFGLTKAKSWVLLANYFDKSNVRNYLAYILANKMSNLDFQPSSIFVDVYFNNQYQGLYLLCEQMEAKEGRVDITDNVSERGIDSFFLEADARAVDEYSGYAGSCYLDSMFDYHVALKYPDADDYLEALENQMSTNEKTAKEALEFIDQYEKDINWLDKFLKTVERKITNHTNYEDYIDVDSFIDYYLIEELFKNLDVGYASQYYYIDQSEEFPKLKCGPVWDFDLSAGALGTIGGKLPVYSSYVNSSLWVANRDTIYKYLTRDSTFKEKLKARYKKVKPILQTVYNEIDIVKTHLARAQARNLSRWPYSTERKAWIEVNALSDYFLELSSPKQHYNYLSSVLHDRFSLLDVQYGE